MPKMSPLDLKAMLASERADALAAISAAKLMEERADAMDYYLGDMRKDMPAQEGRSRAVSTDVADTIEGLMPNLMDIFAGSDEVVRFEPVGPEDEAAAAQETDYVNHVFMQQNPGFMVLYSFIKDALLSLPALLEQFGSASRRCSVNSQRRQPHRLASQKSGALRAGRCTGFARLTGRTTKPRIFWQTFTGLHSLIAPRFRNSIKVIGRSLFARPRRLALQVSFHPRAPIMPAIFRASEC